MIAYRIHTIIMGVFDGEGGVREGRGGKRKKNKERKEREREREKKKERKKIQTNPYFARDIATTKRRTSLRCPTALVLTKERRIKSFC